MVGDFVYSTYKHSKTGQTIGFQAKVIQDDRLDLEGFIVDGPWPNKLAADDLTPIGASSPILGSSGRS